MPGDVGATFQPFIHRTIMNDSRTFICDEVLQCSYKLNEIILAIEPFIEKKNIRNLFYPMENI